MNWSRLKVPAIVVLIVADVVLVARVLHPPPPPTLERTSSRQTPSATSSSSSPTASATSSSSSPTTSASPKSAVRVTSILFAVDDRSAWVAGVGSCSKGGATFASSSDGGASWKAQTIPFKTVDRVYASTATKGFVVGAPSSCTLAVLGTGDAGSTWSAPQDASSSWALDPTSTTHLVRPGGVSIEPCGKQTVADFSRVSTTGGMVLCADGTILSSSDLGRTWTTTGKVPGAYAVSSPGAGADAAVVAGARSGCAGVAITSVSSAGKATETACVSGAGAPSPGEIAVSVAGQSGWLLVGNQVWHSSNGLTTWSKAGTTAG